MMHDMYMVPDAVDTFYSPSDVPMANPFDDPDAILLEHYTAATGAGVRYAVPSATMKCMEGEDSGAAMSLWTPVAAAASFVHRVFIVPLYLSLLDPKHRPLAFGTLLALGTSILWTLSRTTLVLPVLPAGSPPSLFSSNAASAALVCTVFLLGVRAPPPPFLSLSLSRTKA